MAKELIEKKIVKEKPRVLLYWLTMFGNRIAESLAMWLQSWNEFSLYAYWYWLKWSKRISHELTEKYTLPEWSIIPLNKESMDLNDQISHADLIILSVPSPFVVQEILKIEKSLSSWTVIANVSKWLTDTRWFVGEEWNLFSEVLEDKLSGIGVEYVTLWWGNPAKEMAVQLDKKYEISIWWNQSATALVAQVLEWGQLIWVETVDQKAVEIAWVVKNVVSIATGFLAAKYASWDRRQKVEVYVNEVTKDLAFHADELWYSSSFFSEESPARHWDVEVSCYWGTRNFDLWKMLYDRMNTMFIPFTDLLHWAKEDLERANSTDDMKSKKITLEWLKTLDHIFANKNHKLRKLTVIKHFMDLMENSISYDDYAHANPFLKK